MRAVACFTVVLMVCLSRSSQAANGACNDRLEHLGALVKELSSEQLTSARGVIESLQENGLLYSALATTLQAQGITPQNRKIWAAFVDDFYMVPERDAIVAETTSRLLYQFFKPQTNTLVEAVAASRATGGDAQPFLRTQKTLRSLMPMIHWKGVVELIIFRDFPIVIKELAARMRRFLPRATVPLLAGFPPNLNEVLNSYAVLPVEVVTFDAQWRLQGFDPDRIDNVIAKLGEAGFQDLPVMQQAEASARYVSLKARSQTSQRDSDAQQARLGLLREMAARADQAAIASETEAALRSLTEIQQRIAGLLDQRDTLLNRANRQATRVARYQELSNRDVEKTAAGVKTLREVAAARRKFLTARKAWRAGGRSIATTSALQPSNPNVVVSVPLAEQLAREAIETALFAEEIDTVELERVLKGNASSSAEEFTASALYTLNFLHTDSRVTATDLDLANVAQSVLKAAKTFLFHLTEQQISSLRLHLKALARELMNENEHTDDETIAYHRVTHSLEWLFPSIIDGNHGEPISTTERILRNDNFFFEMGQLIEDQEDKVSPALHSLIYRKSLTPAQITGQLIAWLAETNPVEDVHRTALVNKLCTELWGFPDGLSERQITRLRDALKNFTKDMKDADELETVGGFLRHKNWLSLSSRYNAEADSAGIKATPARGPAALVEPKKPLEVLPSEIQALRDRWRELSDASRPLRGDPAVMAAFKREKQIRADLRAALATLHIQHFSAIDTVMRLLRSAHTTLSLDRFTSVVADLAILHTFKNKLLPQDEESETQYLEALSKTLKKLSLGSAQAARIAEAGLRVLSTDDNEEDLLYRKSEDILLSFVFDLLFTRPKPLEPGDSKRVQSALRKLIEARNSEHQAGFANQARAYLASPRWVSAATGYHQSTLEKLEEVRRELAQAEVDLQRARAAVEAMRSSP